MSCLGLRQIARQPSSPHFGLVPLPLRSTMIHRLRGIVLPSATLSLSYVRTSVAPTNRKPPICSHTPRPALLTRRGTLALLVALTQTANSTAAASLQRDLTPYEQANLQQTGPNSQGGIRPCNGAVNPNCVSTASRNDMYALAWRSGEEQPDTAAQVLTSTVLQLHQEGKLVTSMPLPRGVYLCFAVPSFFGRDLLEFIITTTEGDNPLVTFRSSAGSVRYIYPLQLPVSDFGQQRKRLAAIRERLGWRMIGCELLECYE